MRNIAIIGTGPTAIYLLKALTQSSEKFKITLFEQSDSIGTGTPYCSDINSKYMLANIASIEIPPLLETYYDWLTSLEDIELSVFSVAKQELSERDFYPRLLLGKYFQDQLRALIKIASTEGHNINIQINCFVIDVKHCGNNFEITSKSLSAGMNKRFFEHVIMATGHFYDKVEDENHYMASPWPYKKLTKIKNTRVGILGTSLSAIDAFVAISHNHGSYEEDESGILFYAATSDISNLSIVMMSRKGILPEADFYCPLPYEPLEIFTEELVQNLIEHCQKELLEETFKLFKMQLMYSDPDYSKSMSLETLDIEQFKDAYFAERLNHLPFVWAVENLIEAQLNYTEEKTIPWRYAILRMHELFGMIVPYLSEEDLDRFNSGLKLIFVDDYASVPHESIKRILAAHKAGILTIKRLPDEYGIDNEIDNFRVSIIGEKFNETFDYLIDATGNKPISDTDFPFRSIATCLIENTNTDGLLLDEYFRLNIRKDEFSEFYCLSIPHILDKFPFIQGIEGSNKLALQAADGIINQSKIEL